MIKKEESNNERTATKTANDARKILRSNGGLRRPCLLPFLVGWLEELQERKNRCLDDNFQCHDAFYIYLYIYS